MPPPSNPPLSILMYHQVGVFRSPKAHRAGYCHVDRFRAQLAYLKRFGFHVLTLAQACESLFGQRPLAPRSVVLTFDDGYDNFREFAWPALQEHGFPATVFLVSGLLGQHARWLDGGQAQPPLLTAAAARRLQDEGVDFGSHAVSHRRLSQLSLQEAAAEVRDSKAALEDVLGREVPDFCYPYGDYNEQVRDAVMASGYRSGLTCIRGAANTAVNPFEIPRKAISFGDNVLGFAWKVHVKHARKD